jgi:hypothetical protein
MGQEESKQNSIFFEGDPQRFLTADRLSEIGGLIAPMIGPGSSWIERRKESVQLLDDTALRRQISVDFSLRSSVAPLLDETQSGMDPLFCAPVFVLPKSPANFRSFDLCDEDNHSLFLIAREDNARISAEALIALVKENSQLGSGEGLPPELERELRRVAEWEAGKAEHIAKRLIASNGPWSAELAGIRSDERLSGWLETFAHSSVVVVLYRSPGPRRKLVKLTFEEPITTKQRRLTRLGWASYQVIIDSPRIEARSFHFEAEAPSGLRISSAELTDSEKEEPIRETGFMKRIHLYHKAAQRAGAGTAVLALDVAGPGFVSGAMLASLLTISALVGCAIRAPEIASNSTSAPALLLVLPGLIASYVARPDLHALTTRLLSFARQLLLGIALCAYLAAARVALAGAKPQTDDEISSQAGSLGCWLWVLSVVAGVLFVGLLVTWLRGTGVRRPFGDGDRFSCDEAVTLDSRALEDALDTEGCPMPGGYTVAEPVHNGRTTLTRSAWHGEWTLELQIEEIAGGSLVSATLDYVNMLPTPFAIPYLRRVEARRLVRYLESLAVWSREGEGIS